ncbi:hypothetical protein KKB06_03140, partial [Patescibacteria group bacterium]|nr:hypothetical protein [Patescibacteria group bacterium]
MIREKIKKEIQKVVKSLGLGEVTFVVEHPEDMDHGDFACNVAMVGWSRNTKVRNFGTSESSEPTRSGGSEPENPRELAEKIAK